MDDRSQAYIYIVRCANGNYYTGWTTDVQRRVKQHNAGRGARYTRQHGPVELIYWEVLPDRSAAMKREDEIKRKGRQYKEQIIMESGPDWAAGAGRQQDGD
ncbi:MAG: GIY-YIG nuclease family protein [Chloroflexota bacterium]|nr:GIY-YIG nuclease family protein [Chloroflexota bacterium]